MKKVTYEVWVKLVNHYIEVMFFGMSADDFPDYKLKDDYEDGVTPKRAAARLVKAAMEF